MPSTPARTFALSGGGTFQQDHFRLSVHLMVGAEGLIGEHFPLEMVSHPTTTRGAMPVKSKTFVPGWNRSTSSDFLDLHHKL
ncbi:hypothetical protein [Novosphingobium olei]|uniref:Uncharacterized protein n=1 Tax=Novosphingobium olei TaxID=2728851 RepID=A0A7Y0BU43_9SPHN|nr:hypothetical protein [Novosphingobium olei]NML96310.1 hypothetical protein [Novosphingobium olei]